MAASLSRQLRKLLALPILAIPGHGRRAGADAIERLRIYARHAGKKEGLQILGERKWPWCLALPLAAREIEDLARRATGLPR